MKNTILYTWIGNSDKKAPKGEAPGPVAHALFGQAGAKVTHVFLLDDRDDGESRDYEAWLQRRVQNSGRTMEVVRRTFPDKPVGHVIDYEWVYNAVRHTVEATNQQADAQRIYLVGPGTSTMAACMLVVSRLEKCRGDLWQTDEKHPDGVRRLQLPFNLQLIDAPDPAARLDDAMSVKTESWVLEDATMKKLWEKAKLAATSDYPVLILGSTGAGKERWAEYLHQASGRTGKFVPVNCGALPENLIESELFGYEKGAFTGATDPKIGVFEHAKNGTVFLDELGDLPLAQQVRLLRVIQEHKIRRVGGKEEIRVNCRVIAATHRDPHVMVKEGRFREDLYHRLAAIVFRIPSLKERPDDLARLIDQFWSDIVRKNQGFPGRTLTPQAKAALARYDWPGNVRELQQTLVRLAFWADGPTVDEAHVLEELTKTTEAPCDKNVCTGRAPSQKDETIPQGFDLKIHQRDQRHQWAKRALVQADGSQAQAARLLGMTPTHLARILKG